MNTRDLIELIRSAGLYPVQVDDDYDRIEGDAYHFVGSLPEFLQAANALEMQAIIFGAFELDQTDFEYAEDDADELDTLGNSMTSASDEAKFDLQDIQPSLTEFRKHIGSTCMVVLTAKNSSASITYCITEPWWTLFEEERDKALQKIEENRDKHREKVEQEQQRVEAELLKQLKSLITDPEFCVITTQRGMKAYALENIPGLDQIDDGPLKLEIQKLDDRIRSRTKRKK